MEHPYFFGYGSLVNAATHDFSDPQPAHLSGWRRAWRHTDLRPVAFFGYGGIGVMPGKAAKVDVKSEPREQIVEAEQALYKLAEQGQTESGFQSFLKAVTEAVNVANAAYQREGGLAGISTGLIDMDKKLGGLHKSDLLILAGRPSMGKTSLATNIAFNIAKAYKKGERPDGSNGAIDGGVVGFFSLEMSAEQLAGRILAEASEISSHKIRQGDMDETEFRRFVQA
uniref:DnaB-like helicase C-terminal domain-containing protein n=1 Tax=Leisingera sp. F5 TaxID=1813816 RepID=UPI000A5B3968